MKKLIYMQYTAKISTNQGKTKQTSQQTNKQKTWTGTSQKLKKKQIYKCPKKKYSGSSVMREKQMKIMRWHYTTTKLAKLRGHTTSSAGEDVEHLELSCAGGQSVYWFKQYQKLFGRIN